MNKTKIATVLIVIAAILIIAGIVLGIYDYNLNNNNDINLNNLYLVEYNGAFGVMSSNGKSLTNIQYSKIARINDMLYLKSSSASYLYNLTNGETVTLDGIEDDIIYINDSNGFIDKYILQYGTSDNDAIYRLIDSTGQKVTDKDFASVSAVYSYLGMIEPTTFTPKEVSATVLDKSVVVSTLTYPTQDGKSQYIVKSGEGNNLKYGIVDENNNVVIESIFDKIEQIKDSNKACMGIKNNLNYVILDNETLIETEEGFEFDFSDEGYVIQKRGTTGNKIYNLNGDVVIDKIFTYPTNLVTLNTTNTKYLLMQDTKTGLWSMYNMNTAEKLDVQYSNIVIDYLKEKNPNVINTTFMYQTVEGLVGVDLNNFEAFNISIPYTVVAPLESGLKMDIADRTQQSN